MGEEVRMSEYEVAGDEDRVSEWEVGLPTADDLTPLSQTLISRELLSAFSISLEPSRTAGDVNRASETTMSSLRGQSQTLFSAPNFNIGVVEDDNSDSRKVRRVDNGGEEAESPSAAAKRARLVWTPQLHKRFVEVVAHLGIKNAVPKTIMQMMNVEGLTRENVASHLQKYRLYLKRMQGGSGEAPSPSDQSQSSHESGGGGGGNGQVPVHFPVGYGAAQMMPVMGHGYGQVDGSGQYHGFESHPYHLVQQREWSGNNRFGYQK